VTLIDSSAWIEFLRRTGSPTNAAVSKTLGTQPQTCPPVHMELLAGTRTEREWVTTRTALAFAEPLACLESCFEVAAEFYRSCRHAGETPRNHIDCLIAAIAVEHDVELLHNDQDFDVLARYTPLRATRG